MVKSGGLQPVLQAAISNGLSLDPFSFSQNGWAASEVNVGRGEIVDALVVAAVVVVVDKGRDLGFEVAGQEVVFQQDAVFESLVPALDLALRHWMIRRTAQVLDLARRSPLPRRRSPPRRRNRGSAPRDGHKRRYRIVRAAIAHQRQRTDPARLLLAGVARRRLQVVERRQSPDQAFV